MLAYYVAINSESDFTLDIRSLSFFLDANFASYWALTVP